jgi:ribosome-associated protein
MPGDLVIRSGLVIPERELTWRFSRSSGPGGQSVNTSDSRAELSFDVARTSALTPFMRDRAVGRLGSRLVEGVLTIAAQEHRSQLRNREAAEARMAQTIREAIAPPPPPRRKTRPSKASQRRRVDAKRQRGDLKKQRQNPTD